MVISYAETPPQSLHLLARRCPIRGVETRITQQRCSRSPFAWPSHRHALEYTAEILRSHFVILYAPIGASPNRVPALRYRALKDRITNCQLSCTWDIVRAFRIHPALPCYYDHAKIIILGQLASLGTLLTERLQS